MAKRAVSVALLLLFAKPAFSTSVSLNPASQTISRACTLSISVVDVPDIRGMDIELAWDANVISCSAAQVAAGALPGFAEFYRRIDNETGSFEIVLLRQSAGGFTGSADPFLILTFEPLASGTTQVSIRRSGSPADPLLINANGLGVDAAIDTATVIVGGGVPPSAVTAVRLHQNYPNPFNPGTTIRFDVPSPSPVTLRVYDVGGQLVRTLIDGVQYARGSWVKEWDGKNNGGSLVHSGVYVCVLEASGQRLSVKLVMLR